MKFLSIDYGIKRVGLAISNGAETLAFPRNCLYRKDKSSFFVELLSLIEFEQIEAVVLGFPLHIDGGECLSTRQVRNFLASLKRRVDLPVYYMLETLSSFEAEQDLRLALVSGKKQRANKGMLDSQAAVRILQSFLDQEIGKRQLAIVEKNAGFIGKGSGITSEGL